MVRRSFRIGLWIGLLLGVTLALRRTVQLRRSAERPVASPEPWPPIGVDVPEPRFATPSPIPPAPAGYVPSGPVAVEDEPLDEATPPLEDAWAVPEIEESGIERRPAPAPAPPLLSAIPARPAKKASAPSRATAKKTPRAKKPATAWVEPNEGVCPNSHPIKAKLASGIFHLPGMFAYDRTRPDRCYASAQDAEGDGLHRAKR